MVTETNGRSALSAYGGAQSDDGTCGTQFSWSSVAMYLSCAGSRSARACRLRWRSTRTCLFFEPSASDLHDMLYYQTRG